MTAKEIKIMAHKGNFLEVVSSCGASSARISTRISNKYKKNISWNLTINY